MVYDNFAVKDNSGIYDPTKDPQNRNFRNRYEVITSRNLVNNEQI